MKVILVLLIIAIFILAIIVIFSTCILSNRINKLENYHNDEIVMIKSLIASEKSDREGLVKMINIQKEILKFVKDKNEVIANFMETLIKELRKIVPAKKVKKPENNK